MATPGIGAVVRVNGTLGRTYSFHSYPWSTPLAKVGGVYVVLNAGSVTMPILYVGQTGDLSERFDNHHKARCFTNHGRTHLAALVEPSASTRRLIEAELIRQHNPPCNG